MIFTGDKGDIGTIPTRKSENHPDTFEWRKIKTTALIALTSQLPGIKITSWQKTAQMVLQRHQLRVLVVDIEEEEIVQWIK